MTTVTGSVRVGTVDYPVSATVTLPAAAPRMLFGCNQNHFADLAWQVKPVTILRSFKSIANGWPIADMACHWSIYPKHDELLSGALDAQIKTALRNALPGSLLTAWHEPELHSGRTTGPTPAELKDIHFYLRDLAHATTPNILVGPVITAHAGAEWCPPGLDFYGVDTYDWQGYASQPKELNDWSARMPPGPRVVAETNTMKPEKRPAWFQGVYDWLADPASRRDGGKGTAGLAMMTFWNPGGGLSGPWLPDDTATIDVLNRIAAAAHG